MTSTPDDAIEITTDFRFAIVPEWVLADTEISDKALRLYAVLARCADSETGACYPTRQWLADRCKCSVRTVSRLLIELASRGAVTCNERHDDSGRNRSNLYVVHRMPPPDATSEGRVSPVSPYGDTGDTGRVTPVSRELEPPERERDQILSRNSSQPTLIDTPDVPVVEPFVADFAAWWSIYPRHKDRADAYRRYVARRRGGATAAALLAAATNYARNVSDREPEFIKHGATFLGTSNDGPWSEYVNGSPDDHDANAADERVDRANRQAAWGRR